MKHTLLALTLFALSSPAFADKAQDHQKMCETPEVKAKIGDTGSCRLIIAPKKIEKQGACMGTFMGSFTCVISYISVKEGAAMNLTRASDPKKPVINQDIEAEMFAYNVAALIRKSDGTDELISDKTQYMMISNQMVEVDLSGTGTITIFLQGRGVPLSNVKCL